METEFLNMNTVKPAKCNNSMHNPEILPFDGLKRLYKLLTPLGIEGV